MDILISQIGNIKLLKDTYLDRYYIKAGTKILAQGNYLSDMYSLLYYYAGY